MTQKICSFYFIYNENFNLIKNLTFSKVIYAQFFLKRKNSQKQYFKGFLENHRNSSFFFKSRVMLLDFWHKFLIINFFQKWFMLDSFWNRKTTRISILKVSWKTIETLHFFQKSGYALDFTKIDFSFFFYLQQILNVIFSKI